MSRRACLAACALGAGLADLAWLAAGASTPAAPRAAPPQSSRYELAAEEPYERTIGRLVECGATQVWFEDRTDHLPGLWVLEASRHNEEVMACFDRRTIGGGQEWIRR